MNLTGAAALVKSLEYEHVETMFGIPGAATIPIYDELFEQDAITHYLVRHEQAAAHAADGYARATGKVGVCMATSGPGSTNLVTGIATAYTDSVPIVALTGQVPTTLIGGDAFQEADISGITLPITKHNYLIHDVREIPRTIKEAFHIASTGRPGPVLIDIPKDVQTTSSRFDYPTRVHLPGYQQTYEGHPGQIRRAAKVINEAHRPVIYVIAVRSQLLPETDRTHAIAKSLLDTSWYDDVTHTGHGVFAIAGGVLSYLRKRQVQSFFSTFADHLPGAELVFTAYSPYEVSQVNQSLRRLGMTEASMQWALEDANDLTNYDNRIAILDQYSFFRGIHCDPAWDEETVRRIREIDGQNLMSIIHARFK